MRVRWLPRSLAVRVTLLCAIVAVAVTGMLGANFFFGARSAIVAHANEQLIGRTEHVRRLVADTRSVAELKERTLLFEAVLGSASDLLVLRRDGEVLVEINPQRLALPGCLNPVALDRPIGIDSVCDLRPVDAPRMHWVAAMARSGLEGGAAVEVVAAHPMASEMAMIARSRDQVLVSTSLAVVACTLLVYLILRHGLRPLHRVAAQAALIDPINLAIRLPHEDAPRELQEMVAVFNAMLDRIATGYERLSQFSADLAHEIRTPVGALIGQTQVALHRTRSASGYQQVLESNLEELNRLRLIVENILFLAQADHANFDLERETVSMADELQNIAEYFEGPADEAGLRLQVQADGTAWVNPALCRRAIHNLVVNALRYSTPGTTVRLIGIAGPTASTIAVENQGAPIPAAQLERLFDRFYRGDGALSRSHESSGLGLAIVKAIMALHGGDVQASSSALGEIRFELRFTEEGAAGPSPR